ncbi:MAG TPA: gamma-glutamylcyclotransferase family protein, partial [Sedimentisphaerales bacterium]|nr:gamma-glutamylcyclotransferase family protein [Sedimentisphaerales bacterium]
MDESKHNLFIYGSLREVSVFKSICGLSFTFDAASLDEGSVLAEPAILTGYRRVTPDNVYFYAVEDSSSRIEGFIIYDVPPAALADVDRYEGKRYDRDTVHVVAARGTVEAYAYLANRRAMRKHFGDRFHVNLIHELWLRKRIERFLEKHTRPGETSIDADIERRAERELFGTTERDLVISHFRTTPVSDYIIEHELNRPRPSIRHLYDDPKARDFMENYIVLVVRQVILNQFETKIRERYRHRIEHLRIPERYYNLSLSLLVALRMMNANVKGIDNLVHECLNTMPYPSHDLIDYVKFAVAAADGCFTWQLPRDILSRITTNFERGLIPLGAEIELSNLGYRAVPPHSDKVADCVYDNFRYFHDFALDVLSWKVGGYIDDHIDSSRQGRRAGFFECAPGRLSAVRELSRPATSDPWLLNQLIHEMVTFYKVMPHSLHMSMQVFKSKMGKQQKLPEGFIKCLLALGGGLEKRKDGGYFISRMANNEIIWDRRGEELVFSRTSR